MRRVILLLTLGGAMLLACAGVVLAQQGSSERTTPTEDSPSLSRDENGHEFFRNRLLVKLTDGNTEEDLAAANRRNGASIREQPAPNIMPELFSLSLPSGLGVDEAISRYESEGVVEYAERDYLQRPLETYSNTPNDTYYSRLWGLNQASDVDIDAPEVWRNVTTGSTTNEPLVAVIDTGVDYNHPDLRANMGNRAELPSNGQDDDRNGKVDDHYGYNAYKNNTKVYESSTNDAHGTHVAGTIGAHGNNNAGVTGVNWAASKRMINCKFLGPMGGSTADAIECVDYVTNTARALGVPAVSNNSWGGGGYNQALYDAIKRAHDYAEGHLFMAAAGNGGSDGVGDNNDVTPHFPSSYGYDGAVAKYTNPDKPSLNNIIAVASITNTNAKSGFSNYGEQSVDLAAPGSSIYSTLPNNSYGSKSGTSMATPHVAGTVALMWAANPVCTAAQVKQHLIATNNVDPVPDLSNKTVTGGRLNADKAARATKIQTNCSTGSTTTTQ